MSRKKYQISKEFLGKFAWGCYMEGYKEAAILLLNSLPDDQNEINQNIILPTLFLIRHFLELSFKEIISYEDYLNETNNLKSEHNLRRLWQQVEFKMKLNNIEKMQIKKINEMVNFFDKFDPESFAFRYPTDIKKNSSFEKNKLELDIIQLKTNFKDIQEILSNIISRDYLTNDKLY